MEAVGKYRFAARGNSPPAGRDEEIDGYCFGDSPDSATQTRCPAAIFNSTNAERDRALYAPSAKAGLHNPAAVYAGISSTACTGVSAKTCLRPSTAKTRVALLTNTGRHHASGG